MNDFSTPLTQGNAWLFAPSAIVLGALHGLEPGHSKTMMAAFIVAIRGTVRQAILLGLSATLSHTAVVWIVAMAGLYFGRSWDMHGLEAYFQLASAFIVICVALWMIWRTHNNQSACLHDHGHDHEDHNHAHDHNGKHAHIGVAHFEVKAIDTGHGVLKLAIHQDAAKSRFKLFWNGRQDRSPMARQVCLELERPDGNLEFFTFVQADDYLESHQSVSEPYTFMARLKLEHDHHSHDFDVEFVAHQPGCGHHHVSSTDDRLEDLAANPQDPHERAHANDIRRRFANKTISTPQIVMFGLTGGLVPCPASIAVLLLCLQVKRVALGASLVMCFSVGLAITMVASGVLAALSIKHVSERWSGFGLISQKAPYLSGLVMLLVGLYMGFQGLHGLVVLSPSA